VAARRVDDDRGFARAPALERGCQPRHAFGLADDHRLGTWQGDAAPLGRGGTVFHVARERSLPFVEIDRADTYARHRQRHRNVDGGGRLARPALLVAEHDDVRPARALPLLHEAVLSDRGAGVNFHAGEPSLQIVRTAADLRAAVAAWRRARQSSAFVPTMGALHAGHLALVARARAEAKHVVASIFVNPKQFGANEDLGRYPRREASDAALLEGTGCDLLFAPGVETIYPPGFATSVRVGGLADMLDGAARPGHFEGVATVVARLLGLVGADVAIFGEKDYQQLLIVQRLAVDLAIRTRILGHPIVREPDGLALSSRNAYLSADERARAPALYAALVATADVLRRGEAGALDRGREALEVAGFRLDYLDLRRAGDLSPRETAPGRLLAAAWLGRTRLIDNMAV